MPQSVLEFYCKFCPHTLLQPLTTAAQAYLGHPREWKPVVVFDVWLSQHSSENERYFYPDGPCLDYSFWDPLVRTMKANSANWTVKEKEMFIHFGAVRPSILNSFTITAGLIAGFVIAAKKILSLIMPAAAYEVVPQGGGPYDHAAKLTHRAAVHRTKARQIKRLEKALPQQVQSTNQVRQAIGRNYEVLELRLAPKGLPMDEVRKYPVIASSWCIFVFGRRALVPLHTIFAPGEDDPTQERYVSLAKHMDYVVPVSSLRLLREIRGDVGIMEFPGLPEKKSILNLFAPDLPDFGRFERLEPNALTSNLISVTALSMENRPHLIPMGSGYEDFSTDMQFHGIANKQGDCGMVYVHSSTGRIVAMHLAGSRESQIGYGVTVFKSDLEKYKPSDPELVDPLTVTLTEAEVVPGVQTLGRVTAQMATWSPKETSYGLSPFDYKSFPISETDDGPAHLKSFTLKTEEGDVYISPLNIAVKAYSTQKISGPDPPPLATLVDFLPKSFDPSQIRLLSLEEAIYGIPGYIKSIDMNTSSGYFYKRRGLTRKDLCFKDGEPSVHPLLRADIEWHFKKMTEGILIPGVFEETLKDEIRAAEKNRAYKTRLFSAGDFTTFLIQRMVFGTFVAEACKDPSGSPCALELNVHSRQWGQLYARLRGQEFNRLVGAGDFEKFDIGLKNVLGFYFVTLVQTYHPYPGLVRIAFDKMKHAWHVLGTLVFLRFFGTSSGAYITGFFNSFSNWCVHKQAFLALYPEEDWKFVELTFTGDDSVFTVPPRLSKYNMEYLQKYFKDTFDMVYTSPFKDGTMSITWENCTYLKRTFKMGKIGVLAPLAERSIANMAKWSHKNALMEHHFSTCDSILLEAWHHGEPFFRKCYAWCIAQSKRLGHVHPFATWETVCAMRKPDYSL